MQIIQYSIDRTGYTFGIKKYADELSNHIPLDIHYQVISNPRNMYDYAVKTATKYIFNVFKKDAIHHFTDPNMFFMGELKIKNSILSLMDCIEPQCYYEPAKLKKYRERGIPKFTKIVTISEYSKDCIESEYNVPLDNIEVVPCAVDSNQFYYDKFIETTYGNPFSNTISLMYVGNTMPHKNLSFMIPVITQLRKSVDQFVVFNRYGYNDPNHNQQIVESKLMSYRAQMSGVYFYDYGYNDINDLRCAYNRNSVYVAPSLMEGFNIPIIEAMACGLPVVASDIPVHSEIVGNSSAATLVDFDVDDWVEAILKSLENRESNRQSQLDKAAEFTWQNSALELMNVYRSMIERGV